MGALADKHGEHLVGPGCGFLCRVNDPDIRYYYPSQADQPWRFCYLCFSGKASMDLAGEIVARHGPVFELPESADPIARILSYAPRGQRVETITPADGGRMVTDLLTTLLSRAERDGAHAPAGQLVLRFQRLVETHIADGLNASQLADELDVSREHLTRTLGSQLGVTPYQYILRRRILLACRLLKDSTLTNQQIAARTGFASAAQFARSFKQAIAMTPSRFRDVGAVPDQ
jgi:transcriptional regulator GlxA family with amidase domain